MRFTLLALAAAVLAGCASDPIQRTTCESLRRYEERRANPGEELKSLPNYDEYKRQRQDQRPERS